jgi:glycosyltransferase involved in cell wall biosynthesis
MTRTISGVNQPVDNMPRLSIIVATWNAARTFKRCLDSIIAQDFTDWELLVVDGASTDGTIDLIREHEAHLAWWQSKKDNGVYDAWNQALAHARGEFICFLGADDAWSDPGALQVIFEAIGELEPNLVSAKGLVIDADSQPLGTVGRPWDYKRLRRRMRICHPGALFRRRVFETLGPFDTRYRIAADYEWMLRLPASTPHLFIDRVIVRIQDGGVSRRYRRQTMAEYWNIQARSPRVGKIRATLTYLDRMWRRPVARLLGLYY